MNDEVSADQLLSVIGELEVQRRRLSVENQMLRNENSNLKAQMNGQSDEPLPEGVIQEQ